MDNPSTYRAQRFGAQVDTANCPQMKLEPFGTILRVPHQHVSTEFAGTFNSGPQYIDSEGTEKDVIERDIRTNVRAFGLSLCTRKGINDIEQSTQTLK